MDRALPAWAIDLIHDGVPPHDLARSGHRAVYNALVKTAASAFQRGWSQVAWESLADEPGRALGRQNRTDAGGRTINPAQARKRLDAAWTAALQWVTEADEPWSREAAQQNARDLADELATAALDHRTDLTDNERTLLATVAAIAAHRGSARLTLPREQLSTGTGLGLTALRTALSRLDGRGVLVRVESGAARTKGKPGRANVYRLGPLYQSGNPVSGAPAQLAVPPRLVPPATSGAPLAHPSATQPETETAMNASLSTDLTPGEYLALLDTLQRRRAAEQAPATLDANVLPFRAPGDRR